ncbi:flagellar motor protein MotB [Sphingobium cupriresistens]|uniref:Flagellar motor protein n=1 Tax=Sphingobium cupriresistens TaxID=1132417 RepID=A0A8G1ZES5_9SPHN|nr:flagellar motor protein MotB [Sphingobium cupriresistens]RYM09774.1 flagellar motor protein [Sphingobium cupriresistens]
MSAPLSTASVTVARRNRWAVSFADLLLLLLAFFVLLQASGSRRDAMLSQVSQQFGGRAMRQGVELRAADLFVPGDALLSDAGRARLAIVAQRFAREPGGLEIRSDGSDRGRQRFDDWDLAAARLGAVARALRMNGIAQDRLLIRGLDQGDGRPGSGQPQGQVIHIAPGR